MSAFKIGAFSIVWEPYSSGWGYHKLELPMIRMKILAFGRLEFVWSRSLFRLVRD